MRLACAWHAARICETGAFFSLCFQAALKIACQLSWHGALQRWCARTRQGSGWQSQRQANSARRSRWTSCQTSCASFVCPTGADCAVDYALVSIPPTGCLVALGQKLSFPSRPLAGRSALNIAPEDRLEHALAHARLGIITGLVDRRFFLSHGAWVSFRLSSSPSLSPPAFSCEPSSSLIQIFCVHRRND